ncbi:hypothetical protein C7N83_07890 [Neisseria iguanae]|uniref:Uncharacterized protein n=2 Tax=Neisseria iguanae TaxID=90242 RepID=A0A2P7TZN5_9NEIS|nr:hypothetical protein C7N83_07890 [Neisseria iguanae]
MYGWFLNNVRQVKLKPVRGRLRLFDVDEKLIEYVNDGHDFFAETKQFSTGELPTGKSIVLNY